MSSLEEIKRYILYLRNECNLEVTLHPTKKENLIIPSELISFNIHYNSYCVFVKSFPDALRHCIKRQGQVFDKCSSGSYCGVCYAGAKEFIYPIKRADEIVGFISVGGYRSENAESYIHRASEKYSIPEQQLKALYPSLKAEMPEKEYIDTLIAPLASMIELAYLKSPQDDDEEDRLDKILRYIKRHHTESITLESISRRFACSRSYLSHNLTKRLGVSFREYLTELRLQDAKSLLENSNLNVTEIALSVGFSDSNYFTNVFKKHLGISPLAYRKQKKN